MKPNLITESVYVNLENLGNIPKKNIRGGSILDWMFASGTNRIFNWYHMDFLQPFISKVYIWFHIGFHRMHGVGSIISVAGSPVWIPSLSRQHRWSVWGVGRSSSASRLGFSACCWGIIQRPKKYILCLGRAVGSPATLWGQHSSCQILSLQTMMWPGPPSQCYPSYCSPLESAVQ